MSDLANLLKQQFDPHKARDLDMTVAFDCAGEQICVGIHQGQATFYPADHSADETPAAELVLYFQNEALAIRILTGQANPIEAFMASEFRSNGYLIWTFQTLAAFSKSAA